MAALSIPPRARLVLLVAGLVAAFAVFWVGDLLSQSQVRGWIDGAGLAAPLAYVAISVGLGLLLVPGPLLAGVSGVAFGAALGTAVTLCGAVASSVLALLIARRVGRAGMEEVSGPRLQRIAASLERNGLAAVILQRLAPGIPDVPVSYAAGLVRVRPWQMALGTLIGSAPRAFAYTAFGSTIDDPASALGLVAIGLFAGSGLLGAALLYREWTRARRRALRGPPAGP